MSSLFTILLSIIVILSGIFLMFQYGKLYHVKKQKIKAYVYLALGFISLGLGGTKLLLEVL